MEAIFLYMLRIILYGSPQSREAAKTLLLNQNEVIREERSEKTGTIRLLLNTPIKETSLIPLLRQSGIHGFRLER